MVEFDDIVNTLLQNFYWMFRWKEIENRSVIFGDDMNKHWWLTFGGPVPCTKVKIANT